MPRTEEANQKIRDERRRHILNTAVKVFARQGLEATRIADIAAAGEMSQGLVYRYFASKEEIYAAVLEGGTLRPLEAARAIAQQNISPTEKLREILDLFISGMW